MKLSIKLLTSLLFISLSVTPAVKAADTDVQLVADNYEPYIYQGAENKGFLVELINEALKTQQLTAAVDFDSWDQISERLESEKIFTFFWNKNLQLEREFFYSAPLVTVRNKIATTDKFSRIKARYLNHMRQYKIGITRRLAYGPTFEQAKSDLNIIEGDSRYINIRKLFRGDIDFLVIDPLVANYLMDNYFKFRTTKKVHYLKEPVLDEQSVWLVCSKNYANCAGYIEAVNKGLDILQKNGRYQQIIGM